MALYLYKLGATCPAGVAKTDLVQDVVVVLRFLGYRDVGIFLRAEEFLDRPRFESLVDPEDYYHNYKRASCPDYQHQ